MAGHRDNPGVIAPPPLLYGGALAAGLALDRLLLRVPTGLSATPRYAAAALLAAAALGLAGNALVRFRRVGTSVEPWHPTTAIVTGGVYRLSRNPIYVGLTSLYAAAALALDSVPALLLLAPLLLVVRYGVIGREERYLEAKFGDRYRQYRASVPRWL